MYQVQRKMDDGVLRVHGVYSYEHKAIRKMNQMNNEIILRLTREIATLNGAIRGQGRVRMSAIQDILMDLPYSVNVLHVIDDYN